MAARYREGDTHPELGPRVRAASLEDALARVRQHHPGAAMEGSSGAHRSFWDGPTLVGFAWAVLPRAQSFWLRVQRG